MKHILITHYALRFLCWVLIRKANKMAKQQKQVAETRRDFCEAQITKHKRMKIAYQEFGMDEQVRQAEKMLHMWQLSLKHEDQLERQLAAEKRRSIAANRAISERIGGWAP